MAPLLELERVTLAFGGLRVLDTVSLALGAGEIVGVIGPNGAGKSTLLNLVSGLYAPDSGAIRFAGRSIAGLTPDAISRRGVARTFQSLRLFLNLSVLDNVRAAAYARSRVALWQILLRTPAFRHEEAAITRSASEQLGFFGSRLEGYRHDQPASSLSYANRRRLELARAMMTGPQLLLLDEPAAGMNPHETEEVGEQIARLRAERGCAILLIEHDMGLVERVSDRVVALDHGVVIAQGSFAAVAAHPQVVEAYLGRPAPATAHFTEARVGAETDEGRGRR
jgi:branched-chain amino acid transport system ATP-binding protein